MGACSALASAECCPLQLLDHLLAQELLSIGIEDVIEESFGNMKLVDFSAAAIGCTIVRRHVCVSSLWPVCTT